MVLRFAVFFCITLCLPVVLLKAMSAADVAKKMNEVPRGIDLSAELSMEIVNSRGQKKTRKLNFQRVTEGENDKVLLRLTEPSDLKGSSFLSWSFEEQSNRIWMYLPALKKTRRISGSTKYQSFLGSDFQYEDFSRRSISKDIFQNLSEVSCDGSHICYQFEASAKDDYVFPKRRIWVRKDNFIPVRVEYYSAEGKLARVQLNRDIRKQDDYWTVHESVMKDLEDKSETKISIREPQYDQNLSEQLFHHRRLQ